jgi:hypothetical protein
MIKEEILDLLILDIKKKLDELNKFQCNSEIKRDLLLAIFYVVDSARTSLLDQETNTP